MLKSYKSTDDLVLEWEVDSGYLLFTLVDMIIIYGNAFFLCSLAYFCQANKLLQCILDFHPGRYYDR